jgi:hypothetical protein
MRRGRQPARATHGYPGFAGCSARIGRVLSKWQRFFGWRHADCAAKPMAVQLTEDFATPDDAFKNRHGSVLGRGAAIPLGKSSRPR